MAQRVQWGLYKTRAALPPPPSLNILTATLCVIIAPRMCVCVCRQGPLGGGRPASWGRCGGQRGLRAPPRACPGPKLCLHLRLIEIIPGSSGFGRWRVAARTVVAGVGGVSGAPPITSSLFRGPAAYASRAFRGAYLQPCPRGRYSHDNAPRGLRPLCRLVGRGNRSPRYSQGQAAIGPHEKLS